MENTEKATAETGGVKVFCRFDCLLDPHELKPHPQNPNRHPEIQIEKLGDIIIGNGWRQPITVSKRSGYITKGHGRLLAALERGFELVPVEYQEYESEAAEISDMIADNRIAELSEIDDNAISSLLKQLNDAGASIALTGYDEIDLDSGEVENVLEKLLTAEEWQEESENRAEKTKERFGEIIDRLAENEPEKFSRAVCVVVPAGRGSARDCIIFTDASCMDIVNELKRYAEEGAPSPLDRLLSGVIDYAPDA